MKLSTDAPSRPSSMWCDDFADYVISGDRYLTDPSQQQQLKEAMSRVSRPIFANIAQGVDVLP